jgi:hypothetical protein
LKSSIRLYATALLAILVLTVPVLSMGCGSSNAPAAPTPAPTPTPTPTPAPGLAAPTAVSPVGVQQLDTLHPKLQIKNSVATGTVGTVTYRFEWSETDQFPADSRTGVKDGVPQDGGDTTTFEITDTLKANFILFWRARATNGTITSDWSKMESFKTQNKGFQVGQTIFDPLTNGGPEVGRPQGGRFIPGRGWQSNSVNDGVDYDIPTCISCRVEFDVTNFGKKEGEPFSKDLKWLTMGDGNAFNSFGAFRDHPWKMHLEQRADLDTALKLIWRNGGVGDGNPGDHTNKGDPGINWNGGTVYHFVFDWNPGGFTITVNGQLVFQDGFGGAAYGPPNHRISLGCYPRGETIVGAIWSNFSVQPR